MCLIKVKNVINVFYVKKILALNLHENQNRILDSYIMQINSDLTLRHKIENINLLLTNQSTPSSPSGTSVNTTYNPNNQENNEENLSDSLNDSRKDTKLGSIESTATSSNLMYTFSSNQNHNINYDKIEMLLIDLKKYIVNSINSWNTKMSEFFKKNKYNDEIGANSFGTVETSSTNPIDIPIGNCNFHFFSI